MKRIMKMRIALLLIVFFLIAVKNFAQDTAALTGTVSLQQCIDIAIKNNLQVNENEFIAEGSRVSLQQARGNYLPYISASIGHSLSEGRVINNATNQYVTQSSTSASYNLSTSLTLWNAGSIRNFVSSSRLTYEATKMDLQQQKDNITINVILAYLQVLSNEEQLAAAQQQVESFGIQVKKLIDQAKEGALSNPATLTDLKGSLAAGELSVVNAQNALESSKIVLLQYLNVPYSSSFDLQKLDENLTPVLYDAGSDAIYQQALNNLAYIKAARFRSLSAIKSLRSAKGQLWPTLSFNPNLGSSYSSYILTPTGDKIPYTTQLGNNFGSSFGLNLYIPILQGLQGKSRVDQARITVKRTDFEEKSNKTTLQQNVEQAYINMNSGYDRFQKLQDQVNDYTESFRVAQVRFDAGLYTSTEYIIAKTNLDQATINLIAEKYDFILRTKILDYYEGKLSIK